MKHNQFPHSIRIINLTWSTTSSLCVISLILILFINIEITDAKIYKNIGCTYEAVSSAYNAASSGDTIVVNAGSAVWTTTLYIRKAISIIGTNTTITAGDTMKNGFFKITGFTADKLVRVSGFRFDMKNWITRQAIYVSDLTGCYNSDKIRIDHNVFDLGLSAILFLHPIGLIDSNLFINHNIAITISAGSREYADSSWSDLSAGTNRAIFIEYNTFISNKNYPATFTDEQIGSMNGGKLVVRFNVFNGDSISLGDSRSLCPLMTHGNQGWGDCYWQADETTGRGNRRGQSVVEFYNNTIQGRRVDFLCSIRGSANLIYNNSIIGTVTQNPRVGLSEEEYTSPIFKIHRTAWPAEDQVHNTFIWNNTYRGHDFNDGVYGFVSAEPNDSLAGLWKNRDYFLHAPQATGGKATFTGKNGASNTYPTDGNNKYPTFGTMVFNPNSANAYFGYEAYQYPHPLGMPSVTPQSPVPRNIGVMK